MKKRNLILSGTWIVLGAVLFVCGMLELVDEFWSGMGGGFLGVGILQTVRLIRYRKDEQYRQAVDVQVSDERNKFLSGKAWAWAGYWFVLLNGSAVIVLKILDLDQLSLWAAYNVCVIIVLYWLCHLWLRKKY